MRKQSISSIAPDRGGRNSLAYVHDDPSDCFQHSTLEDGGCCLARMFSIA